jgi:hypothetical protein
MVKPIKEKRKPKMRYITIPEPAILEHMELPKDAPKRHPELPFSEFVRKVLVQHKDVTTSDEILGRFMLLEEDVKSKVAGDVWELTDELHETLASLAKTFTYAPDIKLYLLKHVKAITGAAAKKPELAVVKQPEVA